MVVRSPPPEPARGPEYLNKVAEIGNHVKVCKLFHELIVNHEYDDKRTIDNVFQDNVNVYVDSDKSLSALYTLRGSSDSIESIQSENGLQELNDLRESLAKLARYCNNFSKWIPPREAFPASKPGELHLSIEEAYVNEAIRNRRRYLREQRLLTTTSPLSIPRPPSGESTQGRSSTRNSS